MTKGIFPHLVVVGIEIKDTLKAFDHFKNKQKIL